MNTMVQHLKAHYNSLHEQVEKLTGIRVADQRLMMFEAAERWLESIGCQGQDQTSMMSTTAFWGFWKREWSLMDEKFLGHQKRYGYCHNLTGWYDAFHDVTKSVDSSGAGYHQVIKQLAK